MLRAIVGVKNSVKITEYRERIAPNIEQSLMKHISEQSGSIITLQQKSREIAELVEADICADTSYTPSLLRQ